MNIHIVGNRYKIVIPGKYIDDHEIIKNCFKALKAVETGEQTAIVLPKDWKFSHR